MDYVVIITAVIAAIGGGGLGSLLTAWVSRRDSLLSNWQKQVTFFQVELKECRDHADELDTKVEAQQAAFNVKVEAQQAAFSVKIEALDQEIVWLRAWISGGGAGGVSGVGSSPASP